jgi:rhodanese-related sulfurtransferase
MQERIKAITASIRSVTAADAAVECETNGGLIIDVREPAEYSNSPAEGAINIPRGVLEMKMLELAKDPQKPLYLHCASGMRAMLAAEQLVNMGYENVAVITCPVPTIQKALA